MAPKRKAETTNAASKKPKVNELDLMVERVVGALDNDHFAVEDAAKKTLSSTLPTILNVYKSARHDFQTQLVVFMEQTFQQIEERLEATVNEHEGFVQEAVNVKQEHENEKAVKEQELETNTGIQAQKDGIVQDFKTQTNDAEKVFKESESKHLAVTKDKDTLGGQKEKIENEIAIFDQLKAGVEKKGFKATVASFETAMRRNSITAAAMKAIPLAFAVAPEARADFDIKTIDYVDEKFKEKLADIESRIENWEPNMQAANADLEAATSAFENLKETLAEAITIFNDAEKATKATKAEISSIERTLKSDGQFITKKEKELKVVSDRLEQFKEIKGIFELLRDREERIEEVETGMVVETEAVEA